MTLPNLLTLTRILLIPLFVICFYLPYGWSNWGAAAIFALAGFTDWLDGYLARKLEQTTAFGAFLDPVADKLMVTTALVLLAAVHTSPWFVLPAVIIVGREIVISALREWMAELGKRASVAVSYIGKVKTMAQITAIVGFLAAGREESGLLLNAAYLLIYAASVLTLWSMWAYLRAAWPDLMKGTTPS